MNDCPEFLDLFIEKAKITRKWISTKTNKIKYFNNNKGRP